jgi:hypothetical protein
MSNAPDASTLTVFVITTGEEILDECLAALERQTRTGFAVERISDVYPMGAAFQAMPDRCRTKYFLQVDADMVLEPDAVETLHDAIDASGPRTYMVAGQLHEDGVGPSGHVKIWKRSLFRLFRFRDCRTVDRDLHRRTRRFGLRNTQLNARAVGKHVPRHSPESDWLKAKADVEKWRFMGRPAELYAVPRLEGLLDGYPNDGERLAGTLLGALTTEPRLSRSKDIRYERAVREQALDLLGMPRGDEQPLPRDRRAEIVSAFATAYSGGAREPLTDVIAALFPRGDEAAAQEAVLSLTAR